MAASFHRLRHLANAPKNPHMPPEIALDARPVAAAVPPVRIIASAMEEELIQAQ